MALPCFLHHDSARYQGTRARGENHAHVAIHIVILLH